MIKKILFFVFMLLLRIKSKTDFPHRYLLEKILFRENLTIDNCEIKNKNLKTMNLLIKYQEKLLPNLMNDKRYAIIILSFQNEFINKNISKIIYKIFDKDFTISYIGIQFHNNDLKIKKYIETDDLSEIKYLFKLRDFDRNVICKNFAHDLKKYFEKSLKKYGNFNKNSEKIKKNKNIQKEKNKPQNATIKKIRKIKDKIERKKIEKKLKKKKEIKKNKLVKKIKKKKTIKKKKWVKKKKFNII